MPEFLPTYDVRSVLDSALNVSLITVDPHGLIIGFSRGSERMLGYAAAEVVGKKTPLAFHDPAEVSDRAEELTAIHGRPIEGFQVFIAEVDGETVDEREWTYIRKNGTRLTVRLAVSGIHDADGTLQGYLGTSVDITEQKASERALVQEKHFFDQLINSLPGIFYLYDSNLHLQRWNRNHETLLGYSAEEIKGKYLGDWHSNEEGRSLAVNASKGIIEEGIELDAVESSLRHKNGREIPFLLTGVRVISPNGPMLAGVGIDLTERKLLEEQLRQSQKMESVGLLAGGIAHDFNNILTTIMGNIDLGKSKLEPASPVARYLDKVMLAAESAGKITRQLLAFSRKEIIAPRVLDLNLMLDGMRGMLARLLGENIALRLKQYPDLWSVQIDPGQFDQIILNLAVNARDAMPDGGNLTIETANCLIDETYTERHPDATTGEHVKISVSDTGTGIAREVMSHLFEPFFTTKETGRGTGLGLSTTFGAIKQNKGFMNVVSEQGSGATFEIFLPRVYENTEMVSSVTSDPNTKEGSETIIIAEDDPDLRAVAEEHLTRLGYRVLACTDGKSALDASIAAGSIDLLVTDLIMPGMNGKELAKRMTAIHKDLKVLYTSGYTADIIGRHGMLEPGIEFLPKPYLLSDLSRRVRECMDN